MCMDFDGLGLCFRFGADYVLSFLARKLTSIMESVVLKSGTLLQLSKTKQQWTGQMAQ